MCKILYRIKSDVDFFLNKGGPESIKQIKRLFNEDVSFAKMQSSMKIAIKNLLGGTDPRQILRDAELNRVLMKSFTLEQVTQIKGG